MIPITRKDYYLNEIVGWGDNAPEKPYIEEEFFFAEILGEAVQAPEPLTRYQMYLAKIAGREIEIPYPEVRLEYFLAKAAGMEIETLTPITREEIFWSNYPVIVDFEVEGIPPLTYKAVAGVLNDYRIYGNTAGGESIGDLEATGEHAGEYKVPVTVSNGADTQTIPIYLTEQIRKVGDEAEYIDYGEQKQHRVRKNLFNTSNLTQDINLTSTDGLPTKYTGRIGITIPISINGNVTLSYSTENNTNIAFMYTLFRNDEFIGRTIHKSSGDTIQGENGDKIYIVFYIDGANISINNISNIMLNSGTETLPYEPYIIDTELDVTLPALPTLPGTNVLSVGTAVQPSKVYVKYKGERQ